MLLALATLGNRQISRSCRCPSALRGKSERIMRLPPLSSFWYILQGKERHSQDSLVESFCSEHKTRLRQFFAGSQKEMAVAIGPAEYLLGMDHSQSKRQYIHQRNKSIHSTRYTLNISRVVSLLSPFHLLSFIRVVRSPAKL